MAVRTYIGIGSNLNQPIHQVQRACAALKHLPTSTCAAISRLYRSAALGGPPDQPDYINAVVALDTRLSATALLAALQNLENQHGRVRTVRWCARTLDLDLLFYGALRQDDPQLTLPHPRLHERDFVLYPLLDVAADLILPGRGALHTWIASRPAPALTCLGYADQL